MRDERHDHSAPHSSFLERHTVLSLCGSLCTSRVAMGGGLLRGQSCSCASMRSAPFVHPCTADYSHRKDWVFDRVRELSEIFAIDICEYAVMSNHYDTVEENVRAGTEGLIDSIAMSTAPVPTWQSCDDALRPDHR